MWSIHAETSSPNLASPASPALSHLTPVDGSASLAQIEAASKFPAVLVRPHLAAEVSHVGLRRAATSNKKKSSSRQGAQQIRKKTRKTRSYYCLAVVKHVGKLRHF